MTPTQRSLAKWRGRGYLVAVTEHWNPFAHIRQDLFGVFDLLAIRHDCIIGIQTTTKQHIRERIDKLEAAPATRIWLQSPTRRILVEGWVKRKPAGGGRKCWQAEEVWL